MLLWRERPRSALVIKRLGLGLVHHCARACQSLEARGVTPVVEPQTLAEMREHAGYEGNARTFDTDAERAALHRVVDLVVCLGGDGTILHVSTLLQGPVPPIVAFDLGSLGFLTAHDWKDLDADLDRVLEAGREEWVERSESETESDEPAASPASFEDEYNACPVALSPSNFAGSGVQSEVGDGVMITLRMRLHVGIVRAGQSEPERELEVMNELVIDRGASPSLTNIEVFVQGRRITRVQADGLMLSTPTGSTAYSLAAGGSIVHPSVQAILMTPICPHTLSFRPVLLPDSAELRLSISPDVRADARASFDGRSTTELRPGDALVVRLSKHPIPTVNKIDQSGDWFTALQKCMQWNERLEQKGASSLM